MVSLIKLIMGFLPWIAFGALTGSTLASIEMATVAALGISLIMDRHSLRKGYILSWGTVIFFSFILITLVIMKNMWVATHLRILCSLALTSIVFGGLLIGKPFTLQYAKEEVDKSLWNHPAFIRVNQVMTGVWGVLFLIQLGVNLYRVDHPEVSTWIYEVIGWTLTLSGTAFTVVYADIVRKRRQKRLETQPAPPAQ